MRKYHGKMLIKPAAKGLRNHLQKVRQIVKRNAASKQGDLIRQLNPAWLGYHRHIVAKETFSYIDYRV